MDNLFDLIVPIIFIIGTVFANRMLRKGQDEEAPEEGQEGTRDLRDEIRRQIEERRQQLQEAMESQQKTSVPEVPGPVYEPSRPSQPVLAPAPEDRYKEMRHQVETMRAKADAEKRKAASITRGKQSRLLTRQNEPAKRYSSRGLIAEVIRELHHPASARKAIINAEILGPPIGLRRPGQNHASWEQ